VQHGFSPPGPLAQLGAPDCMTPADDPPLKTLPLITAKSDMIILFGIDRIAISLENEGDGC
jgi:hypothetical protein